jgi:hypothetical protein
VSSTKRKPRAVAAKPESAWSKHVNATTDRKNRKQRAQLEVIRQLAVDARNAWRQAVLVLADALEEFGGVGTGDPRSDEWQKFLKEFPDGANHIRLDAARSAYWLRGNSGDPAEYDLVDHVTSRPNLGEPERVISNLRKWGASPFYLQIRSAKKIAVKYRRTKITVYEFAPRLRSVDRTLPPRELVSEYEDEHVVLRVDDIDWELMIPGIIIDGALERFDVPTK